MEILALKHVEKTTTIDRKTDFETLQKSYLKQPKWSLFFRHQKSARWRPT